MMSSSHALSLHLKMCKLVVEASVEESTSWGDLYKLLPQLRHALACTVCGCIIEDPFSPADQHCQHSVCKACMGGKKRLKPSCSFCKDYQSYIQNHQLKLIVEAFRKTCQYLQQTKIYERLNSFSLNGSKSSLVELIQEGANNEEPNEWAVKEDGESTQDVLVKSEILDSEPSSNEGVSYHANIHISSQVSTPLITSPQVIPSPSPGIQSQSCPSPEVHFAHQTVMSHMSPSPQPPSVPPQPPGPPPPPPPSVPPPPPPPPTPVSHPFYPMFFSSDGTRATKMKAPVDHTNFHRLPVATAYNQPTDCMGARAGHMGGISGSRSVPRKKVQKGGCRCGNATPTPGKLTCCGQRCPCYVESRACLDCKCRGCRNPHRPGGKKVRPHIPNQENIKIHELHQPVLHQTVVPVSEATQNVQLPQRQQHQQQHHHPQQQQQSQTQQSVFQPVRIDSPHHQPGGPLPPVHHVIHMQHPVFQAPMFINTVPVATIGNSVFMTDSSQNSHDSIEV